MKELTEENLVHRSVYDVTSAHCDMQARLRPGELVNFLILGAIGSADALGFGFEELHRKNLFWVLSRMTIQVFRTLKWYDKVIVETWPKNVDGFHYLRDYVVTNQLGECVAKCTSAWLAVDLAIKRPKRFDESYSEIFLRLKDRHALVELPEKLAPVPEGSLFSLKTTWFDIDVNKHVTSSRYIDWMLDTLPVEYLTDHYLSLLSVNFLKETTPGISISIVRETADTDQFLFEGTESSGGSSRFRGKIQFTQSQSP